MLRILYVLPQLPYPPDRGGKLVTYNFIEGVRAEHEVSVVSLTHDPQDLSAAEEYRPRIKNLWTYPCPGRHHLPSLLRAVFSRRPAKALRFWNIGMADRVRTLCRSGEYDIVHAQNFYAAQYVPRERACGAVHFKENFEGPLLERYARAEHRFWARWFFRHQAGRTAQFEALVGRRFDRVLVISSVDLQRLKERYPGLSLAYQPPGIDTDRFCPSEMEPEPGRIVFAGTLDYQPNVDGLLWFHRNVWPKLVGLCPDVRWTIIGHHRSPALAPLAADPRIEFTGWIEDVRPQITRASAYVVPLRIGGGVRLKILEAMALGKAIVTTPVGCEGIEAEAGTELEVTSGPDQFAERLATLLQSPDRRRKLEDAARKRAVETYSNPAACRRLMATYEQVAAARGR